MLLLCSYYVRTIQLRKGGVLRGRQPHSRRREGAARPHVALSPKGFLLSLHIEKHTNREYRGKERKEERKGNKRKEENSRKTPSKSLNPILR